MQKSRLKFFKRDEKTDRKNNNKIDTGILVRVFGNGNANRLSGEKLTGYLIFKLIMFSILDYEKMNLRVIDVFDTGTVSTTSRASSEHKK